jgi:superoxide reductase
MDIKFYKNSDDQFVETAHDLELVDFREVVANTTDGAVEKHVPVLKRFGERVTVTVGSVPHPMEEKHYIEWIIIIADEYIMKKHLKPGDRPEADFYTTATNVKAYAYCNIHGLWSN